MKKPAMRSIIITSLSVVVTSLLITSNTCAETSAEKPNIIYIMLDDAGYGDFGAFGSKQVRTPVFDQMCGEGMKFTHHYSGSAVCAPSRCVLMTGLHTGHCRRRDNQAKTNRDQTARGLVFLKDEDMTVAESLKQAGYTTGGIGKWGLGNPGSEGVPEKHGFDYWFGYLDQVHAHDHYSDHLWEAGEMIDVPGNANNQKKTYCHDLFEDRTLKFVRDHKEGPFFLYLAYTLPHGKYVIPHDDPAYRLYENESWSQEVRNYAGMVTRADRSVGKLLELLKELRIDDNTIVFYTSDNGPNRPFLKDLNSADGLRGTKRSLHEGGIRAAMTVRWPGKVPAGQISEFQWGMRDVFPTACELAGITAPDHLDGISVVPTLLGQSQPQRDHLYWEYHSPFQQAVRMGDWKGIRRGTAEPVQLYNLANDAGEKNDVAAKHKDVATKMVEVMESSRTESPFWPAIETRKKNRKNKK